LTSYNLGTEGIAVTTVAKGRAAQVARAYRPAAVGSASATGLPPFHRRRETSIRQLWTYSQEVLNRANSAAVE